MADKLFGTADTGLINAAYRAAMANVPADLSGVYDKVVKSHGDFMKQVSETADKLFADVEKYDQEMKDTFQPIYESMENGTYTDADILSFQNQLSSFRDEWKLIPKGKAGDDARLLWKSKVGKFKNDVISMNQTLTNLSYIVANEEHIALDNPEDAQFLAAIGRLHSGEEGLKATKTIKDGRIVYQVKIGDKVIEKNQEDIKKLVSPKDYAAISNLESQLNLAKQMPSSGYTTYDGDGAAYIARNIYNIIQSTDDGKSKLDAYRTLANYRYAGGKTFREAIYQDDLLSSILSTSLLTANLPDKFDINSDGKVDQTDLLNEQNYNALADYILKTPGIGGQLLANWYAASEGSKIFDRANKAYKAKLAKENETKNKSGIDQNNPFKSSDGDYLYVGEESVYKSGGTRNNQRRDIISIISGSGGNRFVGSYGDYTWNPQEGVWTLGDQELSTINLMKNELLYYAGGVFETSLDKKTKQETYSKPINISEFEQSTGIGDISGRIKQAFDNRNAAVAGADLKIEQGVNSITIINANGDKQRFRFNTGRGVENFLNSEEGKARLKQLIDHVNNILSVNLDYDTQQPQN